MPDVDNPVAVASGADFHGADKFIALMHNRPAAIAKFSEPLTDNMPMTDAIVMTANAVNGTEKGLLDRKVGRFLIVTAGLVDPKLPQLANFLPYKQDIGYQVFTRNRPNQ